MIKTSERLWNEFELYLMASHAVKKSFLSIKGIYYQAEIKGQTVTWLVPYQFTQHLPSDVDYSIMMTFLEFYHTLLKFINFKLYQDIGISYPPNLALSIDTLLSFVPPQPEFEFDPIFSSDPDIQKINQQQKERDGLKRLFAGFVFLFGRETPRYSLELIIRSCGGVATDEDSDKITHQIVDRPISVLNPTREYVQPQWVYDCLNFCFLLPLAQYRPGVQLPPHLSPFVDFNSEEYVPERMQEILQLKGEDIHETQALEKERKQLGKIMMTRKIRGLYNKMQITNKRKKAMIEKLKKRKQEISK
jgi:pescadillo